MSKRILVIDDEPAVRKSFLLALEDVGYGVEVAASGDAGLEKFKRNNYDVVFLDLKMPGKNGVETLRDLRTLNRDVPVYIITAFAKEYLEDLGALSHEGINFELLTKPIGGEQIRSITKGILNNPSGY